jgi:hypothetical protein
MLRCAVLAIATLAAAAAPAEILDRIAANIGQQVITNSEVTREIQVTALIEGTAPDFGAENRRRVLDRLIDQALVRREVEFTRFQLPSTEEVQGLLKQVKDRFPDQASYQAALNKHDITEQDLIGHLRWQLAMLRFIEYRFRPAVQLTEPTIRREYRRQIRAWREKNEGEAPSLEKIRPEIEKILRQQLTDSALDRWLGEVRTQNTIIYHEGYQ